MKLEGQIFKRNKSKIFQNPLRFNINKVKTETLRNQRTCLKLQNVNRSLFQLLTWFIKKTLELLTSTRPIVRKMCCGDNLNWNGMVAGSVRKSEKLIAVESDKWLPRERKRFTSTFVIKCLHVCGMRIIAAWDIQSGKTYYNFIANVGLSPFSVGLLPAALNLLSTAELEIEWYIEDFLYFSPDS